MAEELTDLEKDSNVGERTAQFTEVIPPDSKQKPKLPVIQSSKLPSAGSSRDIKRFGGKPDAVGRTVQEMFDEVHSMEMKGNITHDQATSFANMLFLCQRWGLTDTVAKLVYLRLMTSVSVDRGGRDDLKESVRAAAALAESQAKASMIKI
jgi:hypothetical protein